jgi:hypothetical protein
MIVYFGSLLWAFRKYRKWITNVAVKFGHANIVPR